MSKLWKFSRSHDGCYIECPRKAYLTYYYGGKGIVPKRLDLYQATGSLTHAMLEDVMKSTKTLSEIPNSQVMAVICDKAVAVYRESVEAAGLTEVSGELELEMQRQAALAEGLVRGWVMVRLPRILEEYNIISVEEEHDVPLGDGLMLMSRADTVLERKSDGELVAGPEFKTTGWISEDYIESWRYAAQTLSHGLDVETKYGRAPVGVMMEFLYKGMKKKGEDGSYTYYSPLVRAYRMTDAVTGEVVYGFDSALGRKKGWEAFDAFTMGSGEWIKQIPEEVLESLFYTSMVYRSPKELEEWKMQVKLRQARIQKAVVTLQEEKPTEEAATEIMADVFPARLDQFCYSNAYKKKCPYLAICYGQCDSPVESGMFQEREPHHAGEFSEDE
jgi:hypothetical protein